MSCIPTKAANPRGLHQRYVVTKTDGSPVDPMATYFVLRLDNFARDGLHVYASRKAAEAYAECILNYHDHHGTHLDKVAEELLILVENLYRAE